MASCRVSLRAELGESECHRVIGCKEDYPSDGIFGWTGNQTRKPSGWRPLEYQSPAKAPLVPELPLSRSA